jgi:hypothetical protein
MAAITKNRFTSKLQGKNIRRKVLKLKTKLMKKGQ